MLHLRGTIGGLALPVTCSTPDAQGQTSSLQLCLHNTREAVLVLGELFLEEPGGGLPCCQASLEPTILLPQPQQ